MKKALFGLYIAITLALMGWGYYMAIYGSPLDAAQG